MLLGQLVSPMSVSTLVLAGRRSFLQTLLMYSMMKHNGSISRYANLACLLCYDIVSCSLGLSPGSSHEPTGAEATDDVCAEEVPNRPVEVPRVRCTYGLNFTDAVQLLLLLLYMYHGSYLHRESNPASTLRLQEIKLELRYRLHRR